ncbi:MAG: DUF975 family protein [Clostridia bacterium]|nr:DUF975 family protein [Clostridia bacterium]
MLRAKDFRRMARYALRGKWPLAVLVGFLASLLGGRTVAGGGGLPSREREVDGGAVREFLGSDFWEAALPFVVVGLIVLILWALATLVIGGTVSLGYARFNLKLVDGEDAGIADLFSQFHRFADGLVMKLLTGIYLFLWSLLIIPGIVKTYSYAMAVYILSENPGMRPNDAITASRRLMDGNKWRLFCLELSFIGWQILCFVPLFLGIGLLGGLAILWEMPLLILLLIPLALPLSMGTYILVPYMEAARASFYRSICRQAAGYTEEAGQEE